VNNDAFKPANLVFQAMLVKLKREGKGASVHKPPIEVDDIAIIYKSFNLDVPTQLATQISFRHLLKIVEEKFLLAQSAVKIFTADLMQVFVFFESLYFTFNLSLGQ
jgi:hypothetical protein